MTMNIVSSIHKHDSLNIFTTPFRLIIICIQLFCHCTSVLTSWAVVWFEKIIIKLPTNRDSIEIVCSPFSMRISTPACRRSSHAGSSTAFWLYDGKLSGNCTGDRLTRTESVSLWFILRNRRLRACSIIRFGMNGHSVGGNPEMHRFKTV